jgi:cytochrome P450
MTSVDPGEGAAAVAEPPTPEGPPEGARMVEDIADVDLTSGATFRAGVPHEAFDALRSAGGIAWHHERPVDPSMNQGDFLQLADSPGFWVVTSHELVTTVLKTHTLFSSQLGGAFMVSLTPSSLAMFRLMLLNMDPPDHARLRRILTPIFMPKAVQRLQASIVEHADDITDAVDPSRPCDLVTAVSAEMPLRVLADLLGMPPEDRHLLFRWSNDLLDIESMDGSGDSDQALGAFSGLISYGQDIARSRRDDPHDDVVSRIVHAEVDGDRLSDVELSMFWLLLVIAGNETTRNTLSGSVVALQESDRWTWLSEHLDLLPVAIEELLRFVSPVQHFRRTAVRDTMLGDQLVRAGDKVVVWYGAANRDPAVFPRPHHLDLTRADNPHLAFGIGPHFCLGAHLARQEISVMLEALLRRFPRLRLDGRVERVPSNFINGVRHLPVVPRPD